MNCYDHIHKVTALNVVDDNVNMTVTNPNNISDLDLFTLILCVNPDTVVVGEPVPYTITVNGAEISLVNKYSLPIYTSRLKTRKPYTGRYVVPGTGAPYVILLDTPDCPQFARP